SFQRAAPQRVELPREEPPRPEPQSPEPQSPEPQSPEPQDPQPQLSEPQPSEPQSAPVGDAALTHAPAHGPSQTVAEISVAGAPWLRAPRLALHPGLIAIIGARGSGKTALAEMIAAGCDAIPPGVNPRAFLYRART